MPRNLQRLLQQAFIGFILTGMLVFILGAAVGYLSASGVEIDTGGLTFWVALVIATVAMVGGIVASVQWMRNIDEAAREAHKAAWFWGGSSAMALLGVPVILTVLPDSAAWSIPAVWFGRTDPAAWLAAGCFGTLMVMTVGYGVVWAWWWLARR